VLSLTSAKQLTNISYFPKDTPTISGHTDFFYPNLTYQPPLSGGVGGGGGGGAHIQLDLPEISKIKHVPMPLELVEQMSRTSFSSHYFNFKY
jgi:hypothetical protein